MESNYYVKKLVNWGVSYTVPGESRVRKWKGVNARIRIPFDELEKCIFDEDVRTLFESGFLYVEDKEARIQFGLESGDDESNDTKLVLDKEKINDLLYKDDVETFEKRMKNLASATEELVLQVALASELPLNYQKSDYIRRNYKLDIEKIQRDRRDTEAQEKNQEKK